MAEALKDQFFQKNFFNRLCEGLTAQYKPFSTITFFDMLHDTAWQNKGLMDRMRHASQCLHQCLPNDYPNAIGILKKVAPDFNGFDAMLFPDFVQQFGVDHYQVSIDALGFFTRYSSSEFAIRPFIIKNPKATMATMLQWSLDDNEHVRRLATEGCRPRLPWAMALPDFKKDPGLILPILENLKSDPSLYVRKSVANNINDITKDNPTIAIELLKSWQKGASKETKWITKHGLRGLIKAGHQDSLKLLGFKSIQTELQQLSISSQQVIMGDALKFDFKLKNLEQNTQEVMIDYVIYFMKSNGKMAPKTFKLKAISMEANEIVNIEKSHKIVPITTRKYYPGRHQLAIQVNGKILDKSAFELIIPN